MFDSFTCAIFIKSSILKFSSMITPNSHNATVIFFLQLSAQSLDTSKVSDFFSNKVHPSES